MIGPNESMTKSTHPISFKCDEPGCYWNTGHKTEEEAEKVREKHLRDSCPLSGTTRTSIQMEAEDSKGMRFTVPGLGKTPIEFGWDEIDAIVETLKKDEKKKKAIEEDPDAEPLDIDPENWPADLLKPLQRAELQGKCRGLAFFMSQMYRAFFPSEVAVLQQANKRWKMRMGLIPWEPTPMYHHNPPPSDLSVVTSSSLNTSLDRYNKQQARKRAPAKKQSTPRGQLAPDKIADVKKAMASGVFTAAKVASIYNVSEAEIARVLALP
jgi:hypothetical protein